MSDSETLDENIREKIQNLVVFMCNECGQGSANTAGVARMAYDPGADAVACVGCCLGACHFFNGNILSMHRIKLMKKLFKELGYSDQFVNQYTSRAAEGETSVGDFEDIVERLTNAIKEEGTIKDGC